MKYLPAILMGLISGSSCFADCPREVAIAPTANRLADTMKKADALLEKGEFDEAIIDYDAVLRLDVKSVVAYRQRGIAWVGKGELGNAIADLNKAIELEAKPDAVSYYYRGLISKENSKALADFDKALSIDSQFQEAYYHRGLVRLWLVDGATIAGHAIANPESADAKILKALSEPTSLEVVCVPLKNVVEELKKRHKIEIRLDTEALELAGVSPGAPIVATLDGVTLGRALRLLFSRTGELAYEIRDGSLLITTDEGAKSEYDKLTADFAEAIRLNPKDARARIGRGSAWLHRREYRKAAADFDAAISLDAKSKPAYWGRCGVELALGNETEGLAYLRKGGLDGAKYFDAPTAKILKALDKPLTVEFIEFSPRDIVQQLNSHGIETQFDLERLSEANLVALGAPLKKQVKQVELRVALRQMLSGQGLRYGIEDDVLLITAADKDVGN